MSLFLIVLLFDTGRPARPDYLPHGVGMVWTYKEKGRTYARTVLGTKRIGDYTCFEVELRDEGNSIRYSEFFSQDEAGWVELVKGKPVRLLWKERGKKWTIGDYEYEDAGEGQLEVLGRTIACRRIDYHKKGHEWSIWGTEWYAQGIGLVQYRRQFYTPTLCGELMTEGVLVEFRRR